MDEIDSKTDIIFELQKKGQNISEESKKFIQQITALNEKIETTRKHHDGLQHKYENLRKENEQSRKLHENIHGNIDIINSDVAKKDQKYFL